MAKNYVFEGSKLVVDSQPIETTVRVSQAPGLRQQIADAVRAERLAAALAGGDPETFDEADDFDVGEDYDPGSPYEEHFEPSEADDDELDRRLSDSLKRVFQGLGIKFPGEEDGSPKTESSGEGQPEGPPSTPPAPSTNESPK